MIFAQEPRPRRRASRRPRSTVLHQLICPLGGGRGRPGRRPGHGESREGERGDGALRVSPSPSLPRSRRHWPLRCPFRACSFMTVRAATLAAPLP